MGETHLFNDLKKNGNVNQNLCRYDSSRVNYASAYNRDYGRRRWTRDTGDCSTSSSTFCTSPPDYPDYIARLLIEKTPAVSGNLFKQVFDAQCTAGGGLIQTRFSSSFDEEQLCYGVQKVIFPRKALNLNNEWKFVVNVDNFTQAVEVEECRQSQFSFVDETQDSFGSCLYAGSAGQNPSRTSCKQIYTEHKLLSLSSSAQALEVDRFLLPSACACYVAGHNNIQLHL